jgi:hypothetical protein
MAGEGRLLEEFSSKARVFEGEIHVLNTEIRHGLKERAVVEVDREELDQITDKSALAHALEEYLGGVGDDGSGERRDFEGLSTLIDIAMVTELGKVGLTVPLVGWHFRAGLTDEEVAAEQSLVTSTELGAHGDARLGIAAVFLNGVASGSGLLVEWFEGVVGLAVHVLDSRDGCGGRCNATKIQVDSLRTGSASAGAQGRGTTYVGRKLGKESAEIARLVGTHRPVCSDFVGFGFVADQEGHIGQRIDVVKRGPGRA